MMCELVNVLFRLDLMEQRIGAFLTVSVRIKI